MTRIDGHGSVTLPAAYVAEHVQLGYAATEPGNQSDTATRSATLATTATTCRGLYVAITRGQVENLVLVVTDSHDVADAVDVLEHVLASDRADRPATSVRRDLAATTPTPPAPVVQPRCEIPPWYDETRQVVHAEFLDAVGRLRAEATRRNASINASTNSACCSTNSNPPANPTTTPSTPPTWTRRREQLAVNSNEPSTTAAGVNDATPDVTYPPPNVRSPPPNTTSTTSPNRPAPSWISAAQLRSERSDLVRDVREFRTWRRHINAYYPTSEHAEARHDALVTWKHWADGHTITADRLTNTVDTLGAIDRPELRALAVPLTDWLTEQGHETRQRRTAQLARSSGIELDIGL